MTRAPDWTRDEVILACEIVYHNNWDGMHQDDPRVIELSGLLQRLEIHAPETRGDLFRNPNGVGRKTADIATRHPDYQGKPTNGSRIDREVLQDFLDDPVRMTAIARAIREAAGAGAASQIGYDLDLEAEPVREGRVLERLHLSRERDPKLRARKIAAVRRATGTIACQACGFNFAVTYGDRGADFIECHHRVPLHISGPTTTRPDDLVLLCSNCHRMIHRQAPWLTFEELCDLLDHQSSLA